MTPFAGRQRVSSPYGYRLDPFGSGRRVWHGGIDVTSQEGRWAVRETTGGTVAEVSVGYNGGRGCLVKVQSGQALVITQHYDSIAVKKGQRVKQGDVLGVAGATGDVTGVHLHFEVQKNGRQVNPAAWLGLPNSAGVYSGNDELDDGGTAGGDGDATGGDGAGAAGAEVLAECLEALDECLAALGECSAALAGCAGALRAWAAGCAPPRA